MPRGAYPMIRITSEFFLRGIDLMTRVQNDKLISGLIFMALWHDRMGATEDGPVGVRELARKLRLPYETVRRHAAALVAAGQCIATPDGIAVRASVLRRQANVDILHRIYLDAERMLVELTRAAHEAGALVLWDLSHSGGALPVGLNACRADFAVGCGYKYFNGGPGAPAYAYVAERHLEEVRQPLTGWFGHRAPFAFSDDYEAAPGIEKLLCGTPPILGLAALEVGVELIAEIGVERLYAKSQALSEFFRECLAAHGLDLDLVSPTDPARRGSQLSFRHPEAYALSQALIARGVIGDFRDPDILRLGFAPAYLRFADMAEAARHLAEVFASGEWQRPEFSQRAAVT